VFVVARAGAKAVDLGTSVQQSGADPTCRMFPQGRPDAKAAKGLNGHGENFGKDSKMASAGIQAAADEGADTAIRGGTRGWARSAGRASKRSGESDAPATWEPLNQEPKLPIPNPRIARLEQVLAKQPANGVRHVLAKAELAILSGQHAVATSLLHQIITNSWDAIHGNDALLASAFSVAIATFDMSSAELIVNRKCGTGDWFGIGVEDHIYPTLNVIRWDIHDRAHCRILFDRQLLHGSEIEGTIIRFVSLLPLLAAYRTYEGFVGGSLFVNIGDVGYVPGLAFSDSRPEYFLIPDAAFLQQRGYLAMRRIVNEQSVPWQERLPIAHWRGGTSGQPTDRVSGWRSLPRIRLCMIGRDNPNLIDAGITHISQMSDARSELEIRDSGLMLSFVPAEETRRYKYQIDIDGNTNSWPGLFRKLLTGSPVVKVASPGGFRQWYYDRLRPWVNFVPVLADMSDLIDKLVWLHAHDESARRIGENGQTLAMSLSYEEQLMAAGRTVAAAARYFGGRSETELQFGLDMPNEARLLDGWTDPRQDGLPTLGHESRLELPRPVATESFALTLDLSPYTDVPAPPAQRVVVAVNGEILREAVLSTRQSLHCRVPQQTIETADRLTVTLLHPDATSLTSEANPLDDRKLSFVLHGLTLTPASVCAKTSPATMEILPPDPIRPTRQQAQEGLYGPDISLPPETRSGRVRTHWGTVIYADTGRGMLRHGPEASSPDNVMLAENRETAYLLHVGPDGSRYTVCVTAEHQGPGKGPPSGETAPGIQAFRVLPVTADGRVVFGLQSGGLLLCAEQDGRITLSRNKFGPWERFKLVDSP
jgi:Glycosyl transferase family 90